MTAIQTMTMEMVEAVFPDGTPEQKQRLAIVIAQARAKECRAIAAEIMMKSLQNPVLQTNAALQAARTWIDERSGKFEELGLEWAKAWPPDPKAAEAVGEEETQRVVM